MYGTKSKQSKGEKGCWGGPSSKQMLLTLWAGSVTLQALWRKKRLEQKLAQTHGTLSILEVQPVAIENATTKAEVLCTMDLAAQGMKKVCQEVRGWGRNIMGRVAWVNTLNLFLGLGGVYAHECRCPWRPEEGIGAPGAE